MKGRFSLIVVLLGAVLAVATVSFAEVPTYTITIKDHRFEPEALSIPTNEKIRLIIKNEDPTEEEFESYDLNREEIVGGGETISVFIGPLKLGTYEFFGEFHQETAQGVINAIEQGKAK